MAVRGPYTGSIEYLAMVSPIVIQVAPVDTEAYETGWIEVPGSHSIGEQVWVRYSNVTESADLEVSRIDMPALHFLRGLEEALLQFIHPTEEMRNWQFALKLEHPGPTNYCKLLYLKRARVIGLKDEVHTKLGSDQQYLLTSWKVNTWYDDRGRSESDDVIR